MNASIQASLKNKDRDPAFPFWGQSPIAVAKTHTHTKKKKEEEEEKKEEEEEKKNQHEIDEIKGVPRCTNCVNLLFQILFTFIQVTERRR